MIKCKVRRKAYKGAEILPMAKSKSSLNINQKKFVEAYIQNDGNATQAVLKAYPTINSDSASSYGSRLMSNDKVFNAISRILNENGLTETKLAQKLGKLVHAKKLQVISSTDVREVDALDTQLGATSLAFKLHGHLQGSDGAVIHGGINIGVHSKADLDRLQDIASMLERTAQSLGIHRAGAQDGEVIDVTPTEPST